MDSLDAQLDSLLRVAGLDGSESAGGGSAGGESAAASGTEHAAIGADALEVAEPVQADVGDAGSATLQVAGASARTDLAEAQVMGATASAPPPPRRPRVSVPVPSSVEDLDAQLASLTESLLATAAETQAEEAAQRAAAMAAARATSAVETAAEPTGLAGSEVAEATTAGRGADRGAGAGSQQHQAAASVATASAMAGHGGEQTSGTRAASGTGQGHGQGHGQGEGEGTRQGNLQGSGQSIGRGHEQASATQGAARGETGTVAKAGAAAAPKVKAALQAAAEIGEKATPVGVKVLEVLSKPIEGQSATVRDSLGWVAVWTLFNAACVWGFVVFFQKPPELAVPHDAPHISSDERAAEHGDASSGDGEIRAGKSTPHEKTSEKTSAKHAEKPASTASAHGGH